MDNLKTIKFNFHEVFKTDCSLSQYICILSQIHSNLTLSFTYMTKSADANHNMHQDSYIYFLSTLLSHTREAVKTINDWHTNSSEVKEFVIRNDLSELMATILVDNANFEKSITSRFLKPLRDSIFHYKAFKKKDDLNEIIEAIEKKPEGNELQILPENRIEGIFVDFSKEIISGIISKGSYNEKSFQEIIRPTTPLIAELLNFTSSSIVFFLTERGVEVFD